MRFLFTVSENYSGRMKDWPPINHCSEDFPHASCIMRSHVALFMIFQLSYGQFLDPDDPIHTSYQYNR